MTLEGASGVVRDTVGALKSSPMLLAMIVLNVLMLLGVGYVAKSQVDERKDIASQGHEMVKMLLERCGAR
jgi:hypothetical protein